MSHNIADDPICGRCRRHLSQHMNSMAYCQQTDTVAPLGCAFTTEPSFETLSQFILENNPAVYNAYVTLWKKQAGHATQGAT